MKRYSIAGLSASSTGPATAANIVGGSTFRPLIAEIDISFITNPNATDQQVRWQLGRTTAVGTPASTPTPLPNDPQDVAAQCTAGITHSGEPTYTAGALFFDLGTSQRGMFSWRADEGYEFAGAAVASNGIGCKMASVSNALQMSCHIEWRE